MNDETTYCVLFYSNRLFSFDYIPSRYMCLLYSNHSKLEIKEEAKRGLKPFIYKDGVNKIIFHNK